MALLPSPEGLYVEQGAAVWFQSPEHMWLPCKVIRGCRSKFEDVVLLPDTTSLGGSVPPEEITTPTTRLLHMHASSLTPVRDMVRLGDLNEAAILHNLRARFRSGLIYTFIGPILVSVNPYKRLPIYAESEIQRYHRAAATESDLEPHIYGVTSQAYRQLRTTAQNQSMVISGESGAGKTEATKCAVRFLATVGGKSSADGTGPEQLLLDCSPIMEAFGNAKTVRNNNSSRFGKYMEIKFDRQGIIRGGKVTKYLLEKSRIVGQTQGERNFHIFFMIFKLDIATRQSLWLHLDSDGDAWKGRSGRCKHGERPETVDSFAFLAGGSEVDGWDDEAELGDTRRAMATIGLREQHQLTVWQVVAAILWLGNVRFDALEDQRGTQSSDVCAGADGELALERASFLLQLQMDAVAACLTSRTMRSREGLMYIPLNAERAADARDGLAKALYAALFDWLIQRIDESMCADLDEADRSLGVLDIFGFEIFQMNGFEQLCINFANEKLQYHFNHHVFSLELAIYRKEGLDVNQITFRDNAPCLELIEHGRSGLLALLDDEITMPRGSDATLIRKYSETHRRHSCYAPGKSKLGRKGKGGREEDVDAAAAAAASFVIKHYAGDVTYSTHGFLEKNKDKVEEDILNLLATSKQPVVKELFSAADAIGVPKKIGGRPISQGGQFKQSLRDLYATLEATSPHFVKCIKPNNFKANAFDSAFTLFQLQYLGLLEVIRIRKAGYPVRMPVRSFMGRYAAVAPDAKNPADVAEFAGTAGEWQVGSTLMFMKDSMHALLEDKRTKVIARLIPSLQSWVKEELTRVAWTKKRHGVTLLRSKLRGDREGAEGRAALRCLRAVQARDISALEVAEAETELLLNSHMACFGRQQLLPPLLAEVRSLYSRLELEESVVHKLEDGMEKHDADTLSKAIDEAATLKIHLPVLARAQRTLSVLQESRDVLKALQDAMHTPRGPVKVAALVTALATAKSRGFDAENAENALPEVTEAKEILLMARLEAGIMKRRETEPLGSLGALVKTPPAEGVVILRADRRRGSVDAATVGRERRRRESFEASKPLQNPSVNRPAAQAAHWASMSPALRELGAGLNRAAMRAAYAHARAAPRAPEDSEIYGLFKPARVSQQLCLRDYPRLRSRFNSLNAPALPPQRTLLALPSGSVEEVTALRLAATIPLMLSPVSTDDAITKLTTELLTQGYTAAVDELRDELLLQLCVSANTAPLNNAVGYAPFGLERWLRVFEGCCRLWRPSPALRPYLLAFVRNQPQLGTAEQRARLLKAMDGAVTPLDGAVRDDVSSIASWIVTQSGKAAQWKMPVPVLVQNSVHVVAPGTRVESVVSQVASKLKLTVASDYAIYADSGAMGEAPVALSASDSIVEGLLQVSSSSAGRLVFRRRLIHRNAVQACKPEDVGLLYDLVAKQLADGGLRMPELGDLVTMLALRFRVEHPSAEDGALMRGQLAAWLPSSDTARAVWEPSTWIAEVNAVVQSILELRWSTRTCQLHFVRMAESATEFGLHMFSVCITAIAPNGSTAVRDAVVRFGVGREGITLLPYTAAGSSPTGSGSAQQTAARDLLAGRSHRQFSFDAIADWSVSEPSRRARTSGLLGAKLVVTFEDWVGEGRRGALVALTVRSRGHTTHGTDAEGHGEAQQEGWAEGLELREIESLLTAYRSKFRKKRRKRKARTSDLPEVLPT